MDFEQCENCPGYCCTSFESIGSISRLDIRRIAYHFNVPPSVIDDMFMTPDIRRPEQQHEGFIFKQSKPCYFWSCGRCSIHSVKPSTCANYVPEKDIDCQEMHRRIITREIYPYKLLNDYEKFRDTGDIRRFKRGDIGEILEYNPLNKKFEM